MNILQRIQKLKNEMERKQQNLTAFQLEGGGTFYTDRDPVSYLLEHGTKTPRGRITGCTPSSEECDPISKSLFDTIQSLIG